MVKTLNAAVERDFGARLEGTELFVCEVGGGELRVDAFGHGELRLAGLGTPCDHEQMTRYTLSDGDARFVGQRPEVRDRARAALIVLGVSA